MKQLVLIVISMIYWNCSHAPVIQSEHADENIITGKISREVLQNNDETKDWFDQHYKEYFVNDSIASLLKDDTKDISYIIFLGTWCSDSKREVPHFFKLLDEMNYKDSTVSIYGLDRSKNSKDGMTDMFGIQNVPTFIVLRNEKEIGRIVEMPNERLENDLLKIEQKN